MVREPILAWRWVNYGGTMVRVQVVVGYILHPPIVSGATT